MIKKTFLFLISLGLTPLFAEEIDFDRQIRPILSDKCYACHGPDSKKIKGNLQLHNFESATSDRDGDGAAIVPGDVEKSLLWQRITTKDEDDVMPPKEKHMAITEKEKAAFKKWIERGAKFDKLWSFKALPNQVKVPQIESKTAKNEVDHFVQSKLKEHGFAQKQEADQETLLRRVYLSLTGLIPTKKDIEAFKKNKSPKAYEELVDKLLSSKAFAEHLAVDWLDLARYADSYGYQRDNQRDVKAWKDWMIKAIERNMPYNEFITQQLAGDLMPNSDDSKKLATAFNRLHMQKNEGGSTPEEFRTEYVFDRTQTAGTAFLGLTMECSRCHDHKYDPISQKDYFSMYAFFNNIDEAGLYSFFTRSVPTPTLRLMNDQQKKQLADKEAAIKAVESKLSKLKSSEKSAYHQWLKNKEKQIEVHGQTHKFFQTSIGFKNVLDKKILAHKNFKDKKPVYDPNKFHALNGDRALGLGGVPLHRALPFSFHMSVQAAEEYERAVIAHQSRAYTDSASMGKEILIEDGKVSFAMVHFSPGNEIRVRTIEKMPVKEWVELTVSYDGSTRASGMKIFMNGKEMKTEIIRDFLKMEINYGKASYGLSVGARFRDRGFKNAKIRKFEIFNRNLSGAEIKLLNGQSVVKKKSVDTLHYYLSTQSKAYKDSIAELIKKRKDLNGFENKIKNIMVMKEMPERRKTYVLKRGLYSDPDHTQEVQPEPPSEIFPFGKEYSRDRLGFAKWLTHKNHPLTARVAVNRYWQKLFSRGIVSTTNDFGYQGDLPTHPKLLDYLSRYFIDSGWDVRKLFKKIVMSHTFRQSSNPLVKEIIKDPENKFLARGPSYHMSAEMLMDNVQLISGSVKRSLYYNWKRNNPRAEMLIFGTPRRQVCEVKREKTSTPLQPLVLLNSPHFNNAAKNLAKAYAANANDKNLNEQIAFMFKRVTSREIQGEELKVFQKLYKEEEKGLGKQAAWDQLASLMINLDSFYMVR